MKILILAFRDWMNPFTAGGDIYMNELAKRLAARGHNVTLLSSRFAGCEDEEFREYIHILRLGNAFSMFLKVFMHYMKHLRGKFDLIIEEMIGGQRVPFFSSIYVSEPLIVVWHQRYTKVFLTQHPLPIALSLCLLEYFLAIIYRKRTIVVPSRSSLADITQLGISSTNAHIISPGVSDYFFNITNCDADITNRKPLIVFLGKIRRYKCIHHALLAMKLLVQKYPKCRMIIAGKRSDFDVKYEKILRSMAFHLGLSDKVKFKLNISETEKIRLLKASRALVLPSPSEGFGIVIIEANACGTPVVVSDRIPRDAVIHMHNGLVVPFGSMNALASALYQLLTEDELFLRMSENARNWAQNFTWDRAANGLSKVIAKCRRAP